MIREAIELLATFGSTKYDEENIKSIAANELKVEPRTLALGLLLELRERQLETCEAEAALTLNNRIRSIREAFDLN